MQREKWVKGKESDRKRERVQEMGRMGDSTIRKKVRETVREKIRGKDRRLQKGVREEIEKKQADKRDKLAEVIYSQHVDISQTV